MPTGRIAKLVSLFGFMDELPTRATTNTGASGGDGSISNQTSYNWYQNNLNLAQDYDGKQKDYYNMSAYDMIAAALDIYAEECVATDIMYPEPMWIESADMGIRKNLVDMLDRIDYQESLYSQAYWLAGWGNNFEKLEYNNSGIVSSTFRRPEQVKRHWDQFKNLLGFEWIDNNPTAGHRVQSELGTSDVPLWLPWDFLHFRRLGHNRETEYGDALIEPARSIFKKLTMAEDAMITHRLDIMPSRIVCKIDTGVSDPITQRKILNEWRRMIRGNMFVDPSGSGTFEKRYNPFALDSILFFPVKKDSTTTIDKMQGDSDIPDITDIKFLMSKLAGTLRIPPAYLGMEGDVNAKATLIQESVRFARVIRALRKPLITGYTRMCEIHLALQNIDPDKQDFQIFMPPINALDEEMRAEIISTQLDIVDKLAAIGDAFGLNRRDWGSYIFKEYMHMPSDIVDNFMVAAGIASTEESSMKVSTLKVDLLECFKHKATQKPCAENFRIAINEAIYCDSETRRLFMKFKRLLEGRVGFPLTVNRKEPLPESKSDKEDVIKDSQNG